MIMKVMKELKIIGGAMAVMMPDMSLYAEIVNVVLLVLPVVVAVVLPVGLVPVSKGSHFRLHQKRRIQDTKQFHPDHLCLE